MESIKKSKNMEFEVIYDDGTRKRVHEGVLLEVEEERITFHNGTSRKAVLFASIDAMLEVIEMFGLMPELKAYLGRTPVSDVIEQLRQSFSAEKQACFRLGQKDMQESIAAMLTDVANSTYGMTSSVLKIAVDKVKELEVEGHDEG